MLSADSLDCSVILNLRFHEIPLRSWDNFQERSMNRTEAGRQERSGPCGSWSSFSEISPESRYYTTAIIQSPVESLDHDAVNRLSYVLYECYRILGLGRC